jgi:hypothetical protein
MPVSAYDTGRYPYPPPEVFRPPTNPSSSALPSGNPATRSAAAPPKYPPNHD